jgi:hypothetical protein
VVGARAAVLGGRHHPPGGLPELLDRIAAGDLPGGDEDLGVQAGHRAVDNRRIPSGSAG